MKDLVEKASKQEEIEWLQALAKSVQGKDLYLADLFTEKLVNWAAEAIRNDFPPNVMESLDTAWSEETKAHDDLKAAAREIEERKKGESEKLERITLLENHLRNYDERIRDLTEQVQDRLEEANAMLNEKEVLEAEIIRLKARLFDLIDRNH